jgi:hypothetical protein
VKRIKDFYENHKTVVITGAVLGGVTAAIYGLRAFNGQKIRSADFFINDDQTQSLIIIHKNNGTSVPLVRNHLKEVANA